MEGGGARNLHGTGMGQGMCAKGWKDWSSGSRVVMHRIPAVKQVTLRNNSVQTVTVAVSEAGQRSHP